MKSIKFIYLLEFPLHLKVDGKLITVQSVPQEKVRFYSESFEQNLIFLFWHSSAYKALGRSHLINCPIAVVLDNGMAPSGHALD